MCPWSPARPSVDRHLTVCSPGHRSEPSIPGAFITTVQSGPADAPLSRGERRDHTLGATALVHEVFVRLLGGQTLPLRDRADFLHAAAEAMRRILIEHARRRGRCKRQGSRTRVPLEAVDLAATEQIGEILAVDEAIGRLQEQDAQAAEVVRLRFFAGLSIDEAAAVLNMSRCSVDRAWRLARLWLFDALAGDDADGR